MISDFRFGTALVRRLTPAEIVEVIEIAAPLPAESASNMFAAPFLEASSVVVEHVGLLVIPYLHEPGAGAASCVEELKAYRRGHLRADGRQGRLGMTSCRPELASS